MPRRFREEEVPLKSLQVDRSRVDEPFTAAPVAYAGSRASRDTGWYGVAAALGVD